MELNERHTQLLEARGLDAELLVRLGVHSSDRGRDWIEIPYFDAGRKVNTKYRTISGDKKFSQDANAKKCFWNQDAINDKTLSSLPLVVTEGELDAISAIQAGFPRCVSVPDGAPAEEQGREDKGKKYSYVTEAKAILRDVKEIIIAADDDNPGINLLNDLAIRLGKHRCKWVRYPVGCKDLNDALVKYGERGVVESISRAQWMKVVGVYRMSELPPIVSPPAFPIGMTGLERHYKIRLGDFTVVTGIPSHGKTTFVNELMCRMAQEYQWTVAVASFEQKPQSDHRRSLRTFYTRKHAKWQTPEQLREADKWIEDRFVFIVPDEDEDAELKWVLDRCEAAIVQYGARLIVIDPWNEMDHIRPPDMSLTEYTGFAIKQFRKLASKYQVHVIVCAHPTKLARNKDDKLPIPTLYDISDSAHWANKPDVGIVIYREDNNRTFIRVQKVRYDEIGAPGNLEAVFLPDQARFEVINGQPDSDAWGEVK